MHFYTIAVKLYLLKHIVNGLKSSNSPVLGGIPKRSVLGPLLFLINDAFKSQTDMLSMEKWSNDWLLLEHVFEEKGLRMTTGNELKFQDHIANKIKTANSIMGLIRRSFNNLDKKLFKTLFTSFVRSYPVPLSQKENQLTRKCPEKSNRDSKKFSNCGSRREIATARTTHAYVQEESERYGGNIRTFLSLRPKIHLINIQPSKATE